VCLYTENAWPEGGDPNASEEEEEREEEEVTAATLARRVFVFGLGTFREPTDPRRPRGSVSF
jgi:hypothetical protein